MCQPETECARANANVLTRKWQAETIVVLKVQHPQVPLSLFPIECKVTEIQIWNELEPVRVGPYSKWPLQLICSCELPPGFVSRRTEFIRVESQPGQWPPKMRSEFPPRSCRTSWFQLNPTGLCVSPTNFRGFLGDLRWAARFEPNRCEPNQSTYRQHLPKVCQQQFHGQDEHWFRTFWALLVPFGLGIMHEEGIGQIWIFRFLRSKRSNLEV